MQSRDSRPPTKPGRAARRDLLALSQPDLQGVERLVSCVPSLKRAGHNEHPTCSQVEVWDKAVAIERAEEAHGCLLECEDNEGRAGSYQFRGEDFGSVAKFSGRHLR